MAKCSKCAKTVNKKSPGLQCAKCVKWIHAECAMISKEQLSALSNTDSLDWKCRSCVGVAKPKRVSCILPDQEEDESDMESVQTSTVQTSTNTNAVLLDMNKKLEILTTMKLTLDGLVESVEFYASQYQELTEHKKQTDKKLLSLENKNTYLEKYARSLEQRVAELESKHKEKNVEIVGLEYKEGEVLQDVAVILARKINVSPEGIAEIKRVGVEKKQERPRSIIVTFDTKERRNEWLSKRKISITNSEIFENDNKAKIYINEQLSRNVKQLLWQAKTELKDTYKYIWPQNGKVLVRKDDQNKKVREIVSESDIANLKNA